MFRREDALPSATPAATRAKIPVWKVAFCAFSRRVLAPRSWIFARIIATVLLPASSLRRIVQSLGTWGPWQAERLIFWERSPHTMAVLKSLFATRSRFACRNKAACGMARGFRRRRTHAAVFALLLLACLPVSRAMFAAGQQPAGTSTSSQPDARALPSQQAIMLVNQGNGLLEHNDFAGAVAAFQKAVQGIPPLRPLTAGWASPCGGRGNWAGRGRK